MRVVFAIALVLAVAGCGHNTFEISPDSAEADHAQSGLAKTTFSAKWSCGGGIVGSGCVDGHPANLNWATSDLAHAQLEGCETGATCVVTCLGTADDIQISANDGIQTATASLNCK